MAFKRQQSSNRDLEFVQNNVANALAPLQAMPMVGGNVLAGLVMTTSQTAVAHGLGRTPKYWAIIELSGVTYAPGVTPPPVVWRSAASDSKFIYLTASTGCTITLWLN